MCKNFCAQKNIADLTLMSDRIYVYVTMTIDDKFAKALIVSSFFFFLNHSQITTFDAIG